MCWTDAEDANAEKLLFPTPLQSLSLEAGASFKEAWRAGEAKE